MEGFGGRVPFTTQHTLPYTHTYILIPMCMCVCVCVCVWIVKSQKFSYLWKSTLSVVLRLGMDNYSAKQNFTEAPSALNTSYWLESMCYICLISNLVNLKQIGTILPKIFKLGWGEWCKLSKSWNTVLWEGGGMHLPGFSRFLMAVTCKRLVSIAWNKWCR